MKETIDQTQNRDTTPAPAVAKVKKVSFGAIGTKAKAETKTEYPVFPDDNGEAALIAARIIQRTDEFDALESALKTDKAELKMMVMPFYFTTNSGKVEVPSSITVKSSTSALTVTVQNKYTKLNSDEALAKVPFAVPHFRQCFTFEIDGDKIPADSIEPIVAGLQALFIEHDCLSALGVSESYKPVKEFHTARHTLLTPEQNLALDQVVPIVAMVKTKGRGAK